MDKGYNKSLVFWAACAGMLLFGVSFITLGAVTPALREKFGLSELESGALFAILPMGIISGSLLFGPVADRYGYKLLFVSSCLLLAAGFAGIAEATSSATLKWCIYFFGFGGGAINGSTNAVVSLVSDENKVGNLSLLGVFYGIGALGMPLVLGSLQHRMSYESIVLMMTAATLLVGLLFLSLRFPPPQQTSPFSLRRAARVLTDKTVAFIALFLFFQMSLEAIVNNWTTTYLQQYKGVPQDQALIGLSLFIVGMTVMRVLIGSVFRNFSEAKLLLLSLALILIGGLLLVLHVPYAVLLASFMLFGAGMSAGVPLMLGMVGARFKDVAGTAFSVVIVIGLLGNLSLNYLMGYLADRYGIHYFGYGLLVEWVLLALTGGIIIFQTVNRNGQQANKS